MKGVKVEWKSAKNIKKSVVFSVVSVERELAETTEYKCLKVLKSQIKRLLLHPEKHLAMSKNAIHNFNLSIKNSTDIESSEHLANTIIKELAKVSKEMSEQKDIVQLWQEQKDQNTAVLNNSNSSTEGGATDNTAEKTSVSGSNTPSVSGGTVESTISVPALLGVTSSGTTSTLSTPNGGGAADTAGKTTMSSTTSASNTPPTFGVENSTSDLSNSLTIQTYSSVEAQQMLTVPQQLQANNGEPTIEAVKIAIKKKLDLAVILKDITAIEYWTKISKAFDEGATAQDFDDKPNDALFTEMYATLKQSNSGVVAIQNFNWETVRKKMIAAIDANIFNGKISEISRDHWKLIKDQLNNDKTNIANLFEQYNELFLLLKEVEGLDDLPKSITITTKTKIYPNLSADNLYASIGKENVYVFLREVSNEDTQGSAVKKNAVKIKNTNATSFIVGESLEFFLDETLIVQNGYKKENINWIVYKKKKGKKDEETIFKNEGTSFSYNFDTEGTYIIEAYGDSHGANGKKDLNKYAFVSVNIVTQSVVVTFPKAIKGGLARPSAKEFLLKTSLKYPNVKSLNPLKLYYQIEAKNENKGTIISEEKELDATGNIKLTMPDLGTYTIKITSKGQYVFTQETEISAIKNEVTSIGEVKETSNNGLFLLGNPKKTFVLEAKTFKIPPTDEEKEDVKWMIYDSNNKLYIPPGETIIYKNKDHQKPYLNQWSSFTMSIPQKEGHYIVEAYSDKAKGSAGQAIFKIEVQRPQVTKAYWAYADGSKKKTSGFTGEANYVKANIPGYDNEKVRINFYLNGSKVPYYYNDTKTNENGEINKRIEFDDTFQKRIGTLDGKTAKISFKLMGIENERLYPFKKNANVNADSILKVSAGAKITDVYFQYDGKRVTAQDEIPLSFSGEYVTIVAKTQNMIGKEIVLTAHKVGEDPIFRSKVKIDSEGKASGTFKITRRKGTKIGEKTSYYVGIEGYSTKYLGYKGLNMVVSNNGKQVNLTWGSKVSPEFREKVIEICTEIWPNNTIEMANGLMAVMYRETRTTFAANQLEGYKVLISRDKMTKSFFEKTDSKGKKTSRAVGLIQFTQNSLVQMGEFKNGSGFDKLHELKLKYAMMTELQQLEKVKKYMLSVAVLPKRPEDIYVAVFAPAFVKEDMNTILYAKETEDYYANPGLDINDNGIEKKELLSEYYKSLAKGNKSDNIASVDIKIKNKKKSKWRNPLDIMELRGWYTETQWTPEKSDWHGRTGGKHDGLDLYAPVNTKAYACIDGTIRTPYLSRTYGNTVTIEGVYNGKTYFFFYAHLDEAVTFIDGDLIKAGDSIGRTGKTGATFLKVNQTHLHFEVKSANTRTGNKIDPNIITELTFNKTPDKDSQK